MEIPPLEDAKLTQLLTLSKEELFDLDSLSLKQLIQYFGYDTFVSLHNLNKFEICALDKSCDGYLGYLEGQIAYEARQNQESQPVEELPTPMMDQVVDLNDLLSEI
jgi:hypothetical protein